METFTRFCNLLTVLVLAAFFAGELGASVWYLDILSHLRVYYMALLILLILPQVIGSFKPGMIWLVLIVAGGVFLVKRIDLSRIVDEVKIKTVGPLQVMSMNVRYNNESPFALTENIVATLQPDQPHILFLSEVDSSWNKHLESISRELPFNLMNSREGVSGLALFSDLRPTLIEVVNMTKDEEHQAIVAKFLVNNREVLFIGIHPPAPLSEKTFNQRNEYLENVRKRINAEKTAAIVAGDFNTTPWSDHYWRFLRPNVSTIPEPQKLIDSSQRFLRPNTWYWDIRYIGLPIDFILHTADFETVKFRVGTFMGSDHRLIEAQLK